MAQALPRWDGPAAATSSWDFGFLEARVAGGSGAARVRLGRYNLAVPISVVIAAHNEEDVLGRCLDALLRPPDRGSSRSWSCATAAPIGRQTSRGSTATRPRDRNPIASKTAALNLGDAAVSGFPRFYVDADVTLPLASVRRIAARLAEGDVLAASPAMQVDLRGSSLAVRAYYGIWTRLPYVREGMIGVGVYALSEEGRRRFGEFPEVIADDGYVRMLFTPGERVRVEDAPVRVYAPRTMSDLVRIKTRSRLGLYQLSTRFPHIATRERRSKSYRSAIGSVVFHPWLWPHALVYSAVQLTTRRRAQHQMASLAGYTWERDLSSRRG